MVKTIQFLIALSVCGMLCFLAGCRGGGGSSDDKQTSSSSETPSTSDNAPPVNNNPVAVNDTAFTTANTAVTTVNVLTNDTDADGDTLAITGVTQGSNGSVVSHGDGTFTYTPDIDFVGTDSFVYTVSDGNGGLTTGRVDVTVDAVPDTTPPVIANIQMINITETSATIMWDTDEAADSQVDYGLDSRYENSVVDASLVTSHSLGVTGLIANTQYHYMILTQDATGNAASSNDATFTTAPSPVNHPPVLDPILDIVIDEGGTAAFSPTASDPDGDALTYAYSGWMSSDTYTTVVGDAGTHTVTVTVSDGELTDLQDVTVVVNIPAGVTFYMPDDCANLQDCFRVMAGGDTLIIRDGEYTDSANTISQYDYPPSGTPGAFTTIRAENIPCKNGVPCDQPLRVKFSGNAVFLVEHYPDTDPSKKVEYVKFEGIRWDGIQTHTGWDHIYFKQVASQGVQDGNTAAIGINGQNNLLEDVIAFGKGRYKILFYDTSREIQENGDGNNLCRRCIVRHDWAMRDDLDQNPIAGFSSYYNRGTVLLNSMVIDSDTPSEWHNNPTELSGAFSQAVDDGPHKLTIKGCLVINTAMNVYGNRIGSSGHLIQNLVAIHVAGGFFTRGQTNIDHVTLVDVGTDNFTYRSITQMSTIQGENDGVKLFNGDGPVLLDDSIFRDVAEDGVDGNNVTNDYMNMFQIGGTDYIQSIPAAHFITADPL